MSINRAGALVTCSVTFILALITLEGLGMQGQSEKAYELWGWGFSYQLG